MATDEAICVLDFLDQTTWYRDQAEVLLRLEAIDMAQENGLKSLAFCCISTGVFGYPKEPAAKVAVDTVQRWLEATQAQMDVVFNVFGDEDLQIYRRLLEF